MFKNQSVFVKIKCSVCKSDAVVNEKLKNQYKIVYVFNYQLVSVRNFTHLNLKREFVDQCCMLTVHCNLLMA